MRQRQEDSSAISGRRRGGVRSACAILLAAGMHLGPLAHAQALDQVVRLTLERHPRIAELRQAVLAAQTETEIPHTQRNLQLFLEGGMGAQRAHGVGAGSLINPTLRMRKLLHDAGRTDLEIQWREARLEGARSTLLAGQEDLAIEVVSAYLQVGRARESLEASRQWLEGLQGIASMTHEIQQIDRGRQFDNALASSRVQRAQAEILARQTALSDAEAHLQGLAGPMVEPILPVAPLPFGMPERIDGLVEGHPQLKVAQATIDVARGQAALDQLYDRPRLSVEAYASSGKDVQGKFRAMNQIGVQLVGNVSLLDGGAGAATSRASLLRVQQAEQAADKVRVELQTALSRLRALLEGRQARLDSYELAYRQAVILSARMREQFRAGRRPLVDLLSQETEIYQMRLSTLGESYDALLMQARMAHASGRMLAALQIEPILADTR